MSKQTAIVLGATGLTGNILVNKLLTDPRYDKIKIFTHRPLRLEHPKATEFLCDLLDLERVKDSFYGDAVFCCVGTTLKKTPDKTAYKTIDHGIPVNAAKLCKRNGINTFAVISSIGANPKSSNFYLRTKGTMEQAVIEQKIKHTHIFRPSMIGGHRTENRFTEQLAGRLMQLLKPLFIWPMRKYRIIDAAAIADAMLYAANNRISNIIIESDQIQKITARK